MTDLEKYVRWMAGKNPTSGNGWSLAERTEIVNRARAALGDPPEHQHSDYTIHCPTCRCYIPFVP